MRIVLREIKSGRFLEQTGEWTADLDRARTFKHSAEAMDAARENKLEGWEVLLAFDDIPGQQQVSLRLPGSA